ncbi:peptidase S28 [Cokeromyces recurvatus]|uniref:peptidase S28 n=1 Tax=Cokeromyces recurvatus TaxID=90255 RepID=UPI0022210425|nr:peptidase S28 [Cokeromyces recurvatus]KAI7899923.1 peptidase S28 [Cokeromyces recurvatus]
MSSRYLLRESLLNKANVQFNYKTHYMDMPLDHFTNNSMTFKNRYWLNTDYYKSNGPIILYNGGEDEVDNVSYVLLNSTMSQLTQRLNGILIYMEHRFYGLSKPTVANFDYTADEASKLTSSQALADMAYLLKNIKFLDRLHVPPVPKTKVILYGCSYSGNLAAWMREKYPNLVFAAVASSAPVQAQYNFYEYFNPIIRYGPSYCIQSLQNAIKYIDKILFGKSLEQIQELKKTFGVEDLYDDDFANCNT